MRTKKTAGSLFYGHGKGKVYLKPVANTLAVRHKASAREQVRKTLRSLGELSEIESQRLLVVHLPGGVKVEAALEKLKPLLDKEKIECVFPVLLDKESKLLQVLTDEITVRFKPSVDAKKRKQIEKEFGLTVARKNESVPNQFVVTAPGAEGLDTLKLANKLDAADEVEFATPNFVSEHRR